MSNARTVAHYIDLACKKAGSGLNHESRAELEDALEGMVEEAVRKAVAAVTPPAP